MVEKLSTVSSTVSTAPSSSVVASSVTSTTFPPSEVSSIWMATMLLSALASMTYTPPFSTSTTSSAAATASLFSIVTVIFWLSTSYSTPSYTKCISYRTSPLNTACAYATRSSSVSPYSSLYRKLWSMMSSFAASYSSSVRSSTTNSAPSGIAAASLTTTVTVFSSSSQTNVVVLPSVTLSEAASDTLSVVSSDWPDALSLVSLPVVSAAATVIFDSPSAKTITRAMNLVNTL